MNLQKKQQEHKKTTAAYVHKEVVHNFYSSKLSTCEKYYQVKRYFEYNQVIQNLLKNKDTVILKQDKDRRVVILDRSKYMEKCLYILSTTQFAKIDNDPTEYIEKRYKEH